MLISHLVPVHRYQACSALYWCCVSMHESHLNSCAPFPPNRSTRSLVTTSHPNASCSTTEASVISHYAKVRERAATQFPIENNSSCCCIMRPLPFGSLNHVATYWDLSLVFRTSCEVCMAQPRFLLWADCYKYLNWIWGDIFSLLLPCAECCPDMTHLV